jgi:outer membrane protein OmpA-like peptidoglycan-associated protein/tetratricopeptide (TPR) repeat protein
MMKLVVFTVVFLCGFVTLAQQAFINKGDIYFESFEYGLAIDHYNKALVKSREPQVTQELNGKLAMCYANLFQYTKAEEYFNIVMTSGEVIKPDLYKEYALVLKSNGKYTEAAKQFLIYRDSSQKADAQSYIRSNEWAQYNETVVNNTYRLFLTDLDVSGQSLGYCYYGSGLIYCHGRNKAESAKSKRKIFDLDYAINESNLDFVDRVNFFPQISFEWNEISPCITADETCLYFAANATKLKSGKVQRGLETNDRGIANYKIYKATKHDATFSEIAILPFNNNEFNCMFPCILSDGKTLIFSSDKPGGFGGFDLYKSILSEDSIWGEPLNLGPVVNSAENEIFPWVNGNQLFFASRGFNGYGGYDVFIAALNHEQTPVNLKNIGLPINSFRDEVAFITRDSGATGYFSSNRNMDNGADQVYFFRENQVGKTSFVSVEGLEGNNKLSVQLPDSISYVPLKSVDGTERLNYPTPAPVAEVSPKKEITNTPTATPLVITGGNKKNIKEDSKPVAVKMPEAGDQNPAVAANEPPNIKMHSTVKQPKVFEPILFKFNDAGITFAQKQSADTVIVLYRNNTGQRISIKAYTDSRGDASYNISLSNRRAASVKRYLVQNGIPASKILVSGLGEKELLNACADGVSCTEEQHAVNRRVVVTLMEE